MSAITLEMLTDAAIATLPNATPQEQGELIAALVKKFDAELAPAPKPVRKARKPKAATIAKTADKPEMRMTKRGAMMPVKAGTATKGQIRRLTDLGVKNAGKLSMADAADLYFDLKA
jgi:succinyl-CoA synthetase alpha subunit